METTRCMILFLNHIKQHIDIKSSHPRINGDLVQLRFLNYTTWLSYFDLPFSAFSFDLFQLPLAFFRSGINDSLLKTKQATIPKLVHDSLSDIARNN